MGAVVAARAALAGGATWLAVATVHEALQIVESIAGDTPVLVLSELAPQHLEHAAAISADRVRFTVASAVGVERLAAVEASRRATPGAHGDRADTVAQTRRRVHLNVDTGMHRMGVAPRGLDGSVAGAAIKRSLALPGGSVDSSGRRGRTDERVHRPTALPFRSGASRAVRRRLDDRRRPHSELCGTDSAPGSETRTWCVRE